ncbi:hypothetical protein JZ751_021945, partial [Albula glossodonta]
MNYMSPKRERMSDQTELRDSRTGGFILSAVFPSFPTQPGAPEIRSVRRAPHARPDALLSEITGRSERGAEVGW